MIYITALISKNFKKIIIIIIKIYRIDKRSKVCESKDETRL